MTRAAQLLTVQPASPGCCAQALQLQKNQLEDTTAKKQLPKSAAAHTRHLSHLVAAAAVFITAAAAAALAAAAAAAAVALPLPLPYRPSQRPLLG